MTYSCPLGDAAGPITFVLVENGGRRFERWVVVTFHIGESWDLFCDDSLVDKYVPNSRFVAFWMLIKSNFLSLWLVIVETKQSFSNLLFNSKSRDGELSRISSGYDDDLDEGQRRRPRWRWRWLGGKLSSRDIWPLFSE